MAELKNARYRGFGSTATDGDVMYVIENKKCVYCGVTPSATSTINAAERIIVAIAKQEGVSPQSLSFFDLQARSGYSHIKQNEFYFDEVRFSGNDNPENISWHPAPCPTEILKLFRQYI